MGRITLGKFPQEVKNLLGQIRITQKCKKLKIKDLKVLGCSVLCHLYIFFF